MSNIGLICRRVGTAPVDKNIFIRTVSTQYVPGRKGYAPGFQAPEGTRESTKVLNKRRDIGHSLKSHLSGNSSHGINSQSPKKIYRQELKVTRHKYARELLEKQGQKEFASAEKLVLTEEKTQQDKFEFEKEKQQKKEHEQQVVDMVSLGNRSQATMSNDRNQTRIENRLALEQEQRNTRRRQLLKLYTTTADFVTLDNLDAKVDAVISSEGRSFHSSLTELMENTSNIQSEIEQRKAQLKEVMGLK